MVVRIAWCLLASRQFSERRALRLASGDAKDQTGHMHGNSITYDTPLKSHLKVVTDGRNRFRSSELTSSSPPSLANLLAWWPA
jgi:hypothetical protein